MDLIVSDHAGGVLVKTSKNAQGAQSAMPIISATGTIIRNVCTIHECTIHVQMSIIQDVGNSDNSEIGIIGYVWYK